MAKKDPAELPPIKLPFEPVHQVVTGESGPLGGEANFRSVRYRFAPNETSSLQRHVRGRLYDLTPVDAWQGLPMLAEGTFRPAPGREGGLEVFWNSFGCPGLASDPALRERFAGFLERLAAGTATSAHCDAFFVEHYPDREVEETRRACVGLLYDAGARALECAQESRYREQILARAARLRTGQSG